MELDVWRLLPISIKIVVSLCFLVTYLVLSHSIVLILGGALTLDCVTCRERTLKLAVLFRHI